uniref:Probable prefoldin subunit 6 n=1 Tax=Parastrongyloides trichosuri TaxID=131310 RepID=A0A0N4ZJ80_PARTI
MSGNQKRLEELQLILEQQVKKLEGLQKDRDSNIIKRQQLETQLTENEMVIKEFNLLSPDASVFKLIGPALIKQDLVESKENVEKRLEYIGGEIKRVDKFLEELPEKLKSQQEEIGKTQLMMKTVSVSLENKGKK